jgi:gliding motility-associated-like protein
MKKYLILQFLICLMLISTQAFSQIIKIDVDASPDGICEGDLDTLRVLVTPGVDQPRLIRYKWTANPPTQFFPDDSYPTVTVKPKVKTTFNVTVTNVDVPSNEFSRQISVTVTQKPLAFAGKDTILCLNTSYTLDPDVLYGTKFKWTTPNGKGSYDNNTKLRAKYTPAPGETGWIKHVLTVEDYEFCHEVKDSMMLGYIAPPFVEIKPPVKLNICLDTKYLLTVDTKNNPAVKIRWRKTNGYGTIQNPESTTMTYVPDPYDHGTVQFIVDAWSGGCNNADTILVPVAPIIFEYIPPSLTFCEGKTEFLCVSPCNGCSYKWSTGETTNCIKLTPTKNTTLMVEVTNKEGCYRKDTIDITVLKSPPVPIIEENTVEKRITIKPEAMKTYTFEIKGNIEQDGSNNVFQYGAFTSIADTINISITNDSGCSSDTIYKIPKMICVDAFSPNGDGINDLLLPGRKTIVFDRTEKILYQGWDGWDGRLSGREMPEGTYFYVLFDENNKVFCKSPVTLLRSSIAK